jgi:hypothetical protein
MKRNGAKESLLKNAEQLLQQYHVGLAEQT